MAKPRRSFIDRLIRWWRGSSSVRRGAMSRGECEDDPEAALIELQEEQGMIAQELEETFLAYDRKLQAMAKRLAGTDEASPTERELGKLRVEQLELWRLIRRAQAASRTTRELKRELKEWRAREAGVAPFGHPDHPGTRVELVASELKVRGVEGTGRQQEEGTRRRDPSASSRQAVRSWGSGGSRPDQTAAVPAQAAVEDVQFIEPAGPE